jgi:hypoxanthine-guanine phosphoribosyltransferase
MIERFLFADWQEPPDKAGFQDTYSGVLAGIRRSLESVLASVDSPGAVQDVSFTDAVLDIYIKAPAIINVVLNYKICVENGLPLHPTEYFGIDDARKGSVSYTDEQVSAANALYLLSVGLSKKVMALDKKSVFKLDIYTSLLPGILKDFVYIHSNDKYTWRASSPMRVAALAKSISDAGEDIDLVLGAAHGSIRPGLLLSNLLRSDVYFVRQSSFKRKDNAPVISGVDLAFLRAYQGRNVLLFDEDVAKGETLQRFKEHLGPLFEHSSTAAVLAHYHAGFRPDFAGEFWCDGE